MIEFWSVIVAVAAVATIFLVMLYQTIKATLERTRPDPRTESHGIGTEEETGMGRMDIEANRRLADETLTVKLPRWAWEGIVRGIERWTGREAGDIAILAAAEVIEPESHVEGFGR